MVVLDLLFGQKINFWEFFKVALKLFRVCLVRLGLRDYRLGLGIRGKGLAIRVTVGRGSVNVFQSFPLKGLF